MSKVVSFVVTQARCVSLCSDLAATPGRYWTNGCRNNSAHSAPRSIARPPGKNRPLLLTGRPANDGKRLPVTNPWNSGVVGSVATITRVQLDTAIAAHLAGGPALNRHARSEILQRARVFGGKCAERANVR